MTEPRMATKTESTKRELRILLFTTIGFAVILPLVYYLTSLPFVYSFTLGYLVCLVTVLLGVASVRWGFNKKSATFYKVVWGGMLFRLALFCLVMIILIRFTALPVSGFFVSFVLFYLVLQVQQVRLVQETLKKDKQ